MKQAYFAGGCFWCVEHDLRHADGVLNVVSGYITDKNIENNSSVYSNHSGYREAVKVEYSEVNSTFKKLCQFFLDHIDVTDDGGQFYDRGEAYQTAIYFSNDEEKNIAESLINELNSSGMFDKAVAVEILPFVFFKDAEECHQNYAEKNSQHYVSYRSGSGRGQLVENVCELRKKFPWKNNMKDEKELTEEELQVLRKGGTERPGSGKYLHEKREGEYMCKYCDNVLFVSDSKFDSGTGWPSFDTALPGSIEEIQDDSHGMNRIEIRCAKCHSHLGHKFNDGPTGTGVRYCMNSVCLLHSDDK